MSSQNNCLGVILIVLCVTTFKAQGIINQGPTNVTYIPGQTSLPITLTCNVTGFASWIVNGSSYLTSQLTAGLLNGHNASGADILINIPMNDTEYICVSSTQNVAVNSTPAFIYIAAAPSMITNLTIVASSIRKRFFDSVNDNVSLTLNWDEPFANFDPIVNYTVTISCTYTSSCPVILNVTTTSVGVNFISDYTPTMSTPLSVTASNSIGTSDPTTIVTGRPGRIEVLVLTCGAVDLINQCNLTWEEVATFSPPTYSISIIGSGIASMPLTLQNTTMVTFDLPAVNSDVRAFVRVIDIFGTAEISHVVRDNIMSSSVTNTITALDSPNENRTLHSITVNCTIKPSSTADMCEVRVTANGQTLIGTASITSGIATVTVNGLMCEVTYNITAGGTLNGVLVGPRSFRGNITTGYCPQVMTTTSIATTTTMNVTAVTTPTPTVTSDEGTLDGGTVETTCCVILIPLTSLIATMLLM